MSVVHLDPSLHSANLGDQVIAMAVREALSDVTVLASAPTRNAPSLDDAKVIARADRALVGGTNLLSSNRPFYRQWKVGASFRMLRHKVILMGVGWWQYQDEPNPYTEYFYKHLLDPEATHSARDQYTADRLERMGFRVLNTGCPTLWGLEDQDVRRSPAGRTVVTTLTDYNKSREFDTALLAGLKDRYERVVLWPQSVRDRAYAQTLPVTVETLEPSLEAFDRFLADTRPDYVGTRLHGGVRALQQGLYTQIIAVDNRAVEMGRDFGLPVVSRDKSATLNAVIRDREGYIAVPMDRVATWSSLLRERA